MITATINDVPGRKIVEILGTVRGNTVRARHLGKDIAAVFKNMVGGEIDDYTKLLAESREQSFDRMVAEAQARGADAILGIRYSTSAISAGAAEILVYGTAVKLE